MPLPAAAAAAAAGGGIASILARLIPSLLLAIPVTLLGFGVAGAVQGGMQAMPSIASLFASILQILPLFLVMPLFTMIFSMTIPIMTTIIERVREIRRRREE